PYIVRLPDGDRAQATLPVVVVPAEDALALTGLGRRPGQGSYWMRGGGDDGDRGDRGEGADFASIAELAAAPGWPDDEGALRGALASAESLVRFAEGRGAPPDAPVWLAAACAVGFLNTEHAASLTGWPGWPLEQGTLTPAEAEAVV